MQIATDMDIRNRAHSCPSHETYYIFTDWQYDVNPNFVSIIE